MSFEFPDTHANIMINAALSTQKGRNHPGPLAASVNIRKSTNANGVNPL